MSAPGTPAHNRKYSEHDQGKVEELRGKGWSYRQISRALAINLTVVARMARNEWSHKTIPRLRPCKHGCGRMLLRRTRKEPSCRPCHDKRRTDRSRDARRYYVLRDLFGFTDLEFYTFVKLCRRAVMRDDDVVIQAILGEVRDP